MRLEGKIGAVTGGGSGIGRAICQAFAREGAQVVVADINTAAAEGVAKEIVQAGGEAVALRTDVRDKEQCQALIDHAVETYGGLDIMVNNAGVIKIVPFLETTEEDWDNIIAVNCKGALFCGQAAARQMIAQGRGGKIINLASQAGRRGEALVIAYCAAKAAVISMTQSMALALAPYNINVNAIAPGIVATPLWEDVDRQFAKLLGMQPGEPIKTFVQSIPLKRPQRPEDIAAMAVFLASSDSDNITQQCYNVDGGNWPS